MNFPSHTSIVLIAASFLAVSCAVISPDTKRAVSSAQEFSTFSIQRSVLVALLGLSRIESERSISGVRGGRVFYSEIWTLPDGSEIRAFDSKFVGEVTIIPGNIDKLLNTPTKIIIPPRKSFSSLLIVDSRGGILYTSDHTQKDVEQGGGGNSAALRASP
jgi:hypothetical protein